MRNNDYIKQKRHFSDMFKAEKLPGKALNQGL